MSYKNMKHLLDFGGQIAHLLERSSTTKVNPMQISEIGHNSYKKC